MNDKYLIDLAYNAGVDHAMVEKLLEDNERLVAEIERLREDKEKDRCISEDEVVIAAVDIKMADIRSALKECGVLPSWENIDTVYRSVFQEDVNLVEDSMKFAARAFFKQVIEAIKQGGGLPEDEAVTT